MGPVSSGTCRFQHWEYVYVDSLRFHLVYAAIILRFQFIFAELNHVLKSVTDFVIINPEAR